MGTGPDLVSLVLPKFTSSIPSPTLTFHHTHDPSISSAFQPPARGSISGFPCPTLGEEDTPVQGPELFVFRESSLGVPSPIPSRAASAEGAG